MKDIQKEITPISSDDLFIVLNHPNAKFDYPVHYHSDYEINLVMNTYGERIVGDSVEKFDNLDLVMTGPNLPHAWKGEICSSMVMEAGSIMWRSILETDRWYMQVPLVPESKSPVHTTVIR